MGLLDSYAAYFKTAVPQFATISRFLSLANFVHGILKPGGTCNGGGLGALIFVMTLFAILSMLVVQFITMLTNPLMAFASGYVLDKSIGWLMGQAQNCK